MPEKDKRLAITSAIAIALALGSLAYTILIARGVIKLSGQEIICIERIFEGAPGEQGEAGQPGEPGEPGQTGEPGPQGIQGICGPAGEIGLQGPPGPAGATGATGPIGPQGLQGIQGLTGPRGLTGETGPRGLQGIQGETGATGAKGDKGDPGVRGSYYGSFYDTLDQPRSGDTPIDIPIAMLLNSTSSASGISIVDSSKITIANTGFYNIQFSVQIVDTGTNPAVVHIWLRKNGTDIAWTNTGFEVEKKGGKLVAAWNFIEGANAGDYFQLMWSTDERSVKLEAFPVSTSPAYPAIPSLILTVEQVS